jgi:ribonuclease VapC
VIVDSSALLAMLLKEPERLRLGDAIAIAETKLISAATLLETAMVIEGRHGDQGGAALDHMVSELRLQAIPFTPGQVDIAREAFRRFGKGRHPAGLNFGDCMAYALAKERSEPLLFKGDDFSKTDIEVAAY